MDEMKELDRFTGYYGRVIGHCGKGIFILLDNGVTGFAYHGAPEDTRVLCSVEKQWPPEENRHPRMKVESVFVESVA